jgi:hypothetical protein
LVDEVDVDVVGNVGKVVEHIDADDDDGDVAHRY